MINGIDYDGTASHIPLLATVIEQTDGSILEIGCGFYSTPLLHVLCQKNRRPLLSIDNCPEWIKKFEWLEIYMHEFEYVKWHEWRTDQRNWNVVFLDNGPTTERGLCLKHIKDKADFIIVHDSQAEDIYGFDFSVFPWRYDYTRFEPKTTLVSMKYNVNTFFDLREL